MMRPARIRFESITFQYSSGENRTIYRTLAEHLKSSTDMSIVLSRNWDPHSLQEHSRPHGHCK